MTIALVLAGGILTGWVIQMLSESYHAQHYDDLDGYRPTEEDLVNWDRHTKGGRRG